MPVEKPGFLATPDPLQQAIGHLNAGRLELAERAAHEVLALRPGDASALKVLGCIALNRARPDEAIPLLEQARERQPRDPLTHFYLGEANRLRQSFDTAHRHYKKAVKLNPDFAEAHAQMGDALRALGRWIEAADAYRKALKKRADQPGCYSGLALLAVRSGDFPQAARHFEAALKLVPAADTQARASLWANLGSARLDSGAGPAGIEALTQAVRCAPETTDYWRLLAHNLLHIRAVPAGPDFRETLLALLGRDDVNPRTLATAAIAALKSDPAIARLLEALAGDPARSDSVLEGHRATVDGLLCDALLRALLSNAPIPDVGLELLLTGIRRALLMALIANADSAADTAFDLAFVCALARQCFLNEYVYLTSGDEDRALRTLLAALERADFGSANEDWMRLAIIACYVPLNETGAAEINLAAAPEPIRTIVREQIEEPRQEYALMADLEALRPVQDEVSLSVQSQYEENPFPRWTRCQIVTPLPMQEAVRAVLPHIADQQVPQPDAPRILIAGCGTGLQTMNVVNSYQNASVLAVDLSRRSLAYGMRKLAEYGVASVRHLQADILDLGLLEERFDLIESFGVIHHMGDPAQGLQVLANLLKPGGLLLLGLYSAIGRRSVVAARRLIAERQYPATVQGIRAARRDIMSGDTAPELAALASPASDFWTTSDCRDLIFHVEEHRFTLLDVDVMLRRFDLEFLGIELARPADRRRFASEYRRRDAHLSLPVWHEFETRFPDTFGDTYRIWARSRPSAS